jgi:dTDP-4-amino-4,6-dideoxy-D-galactose acyltransferase
MPAADRPVPEGFRWLEWDSNHFGLRVARLLDPHLPVDTLRHLLTEADQAGLQLVYWPADPSLPVTADWFAPWSGFLADRKVVYRRSVREWSPPPATRAPDGVAIHEFPRGPATPELIALAIAAGEYSRFRRDERLDPTKFRALFEIWIDRSTQRELADVVLVATDESGHTVGLVTVAVREGVGDIGLVAVRESCRGRGVGTRLVNTALAWMQQAGVGESTVVTQRENLAACRLYEQLGYVTSEVSALYHLWSPTTRLA